MPFESCCVHPHSAVSLIKNEFSEAKQRLSAKQPDEDFVLNWVTVNPASACTSHLVDRVRPLSFSSAALTDSHTHTQ